MSKYVTEVSAKLNKSEADQLNETLSSFSENLVIDLEEQISMREASIKRIEGTVKKLNSEINKAKKDSPLTFYKKSLTTEEYLKNYNERMANYRALENKILNHTQEINQLKEEIERFNEIIEFHQS